MEARTTKWSRTVLVVWAAALALGVAGLIGLDTGIRAYAFQRQAQDYEYHLAKAAQRIEAHKLQEARPFVDRALELAPLRPEPHVMLGHLLFRSKNWREAIEAYGRAIELHSQDTGIVQNVVWAYIELGQFEQAAAIGEEALKKGLRAPALSRYIAEAYFRARQYQKAIPHLRNALEQYPGDRYLMDHLRQAYQRTGQDKQAEGMAERIAELEATVAAPATGR